MTKFFKYALFALLSAASAAALADAKPAATVNGVAIPQERVDFYVKTVLAQSPQAKDTPELRKNVLSKLEEMEFMSQEAIRLGLDKNADTRMDLELAKQNVLAGSLVQDRVKNTIVTDEALNKEYQDIKASAGDKEYNVRHILVSTQAEADKLAATLKKNPGSFDKLAKSESKDAGSKENGGDLGWIPVNSIPTAFVKPFADAVMKLQKGQISEPVQSQFGWHVIKLEGMRDLKLPSKEEIKPQLTQRIKQKAVESYLSDLRSKAKIVE